MIIMKMTMKVNDRMEENGRKLIGKKDILNRSGEEGKRIKGGCREQCVCGGRGGGGRKKGYSGQSRQRTFCIIL